MWSPKKRGTSHYPSPSPCRLCFLLQSCVARLKVAEERKRECAMCQILIAECPSKKDENSQAKKTYTCSPKNRGHSTIPRLPSLLHSCAACLKVAEERNTESDICQIVLAGGPSKGKKKQQQAEQEIYTWSPRKWDVPLLFLTIALPCVLKRS